MNSNKAKQEQLGVPIGTATAVLRKSILFDVIKRHGENICFQCGEEIKSVGELSIEHKVPWLYSSNPKELFFSLDNIAFSHLSCNVKASRRKSSECGTRRKYEFYGCRCKECTDANAVAKKSWRKRRNDKLGV